MTKIMIVDDDPDVRNLIGRILKRSGYDVEFSEGGISAYTKLLSTPVDLIIVDYNMPAMNGVEFVQYIRKESELAKVPVLILSSDGEMSLVDSAKKAGAQGWVVKSFDGKGLVQAVRTILSRHQAHAH